MCLICKNRPRIAQKDFSVYKIFTANNFSPYQRMDYSHYIGKRFDAYDNECITKMTELSHYIQVHGGFVHSFANLKNAEGEIDFLSQFEMEHFIIRKCTIPKGTKYYQSSTEVASKSIIIGEEVIRYVPDNSWFRKKNC